MKSSRFTLVTTLGGSGFAFLLATTLAACSSAGDGDAPGSVGEALGSCGPGLVVKCGDETVGNKLTCWCDVPQSIADTAYRPSPADDNSESCGSSSTPIPIALAGKGCTLGIVINGDPLWACPSANLVPLSALPRTFGVIEFAEGTTRSLPACAAAPSVMCERIGIARALTSACLGSPRSGWVFVWDHAVNETPDGGTPQNCPEGSCPGPAHAGDVTWL